MSHPNGSQSKSGWSPINNIPTGHSQTRSFGFFKWWYRLTTPVKPPTNASFIRRDSYRKACLFSNVTLFLFVASALSIPLWLFLMHPYMLYMAPVALVMTCVGLRLNRLGRTLTAGVVQVISFEAILTSVTLTITPLNSANIQVLDLFIVGELLTALLLPVRYVFLAALYNSLFVWLNISHQLSTQNITLPLRSQFISIMAHTIGLQFMVAGVSSIWIYNIAKAISCGEKAERVTTLEYTLLEQRKELESGIEQIIQTYVSIANGNLHARVPLARDHMLWQVARALNSLLLRLQRASCSERELHRTQQAISNTVSIIQKSAQQHQQARLPFTQTAIDPLIAAIQGKTFAFTRPLQRMPPLNEESPLGRDWHIPPHAGETPDAHPAQRYNLAGEQ